MPRLPLRIVILVLAGFLGGTAAGWFSHRELTRPTAVPAEARSIPTGASGQGSFLPPGDVASGEASKSPSPYASREVDPAVPPSLAKFPALVSDALKLPDVIDSGVRLREIMRAIPLEDLPAVYLQAKKFGPQVLSALGQRWAESDPPAAAAFALKQGADQMFGRNALLQGVFSTWAVTAPANAMAWVEDSPPGAYRDSMMVEVIQTVGESNPQLALQMLRRNATALNSRAFVAFSFFGSWAGRDPQAAAGGALQFRGNLAQDALNGVAKAWAERDPGAALRWIESLPKTFSRQNLLDTVGRKWADNDPRAELAWARGLKDEDSRRAATSYGIARLATADLGATLDMIQRLPAGDEHDAAIQAAAHGVGDYDARGALQILDQMSVGPLRNEHIEELCKVWSQAEPRAALDWLIKNAPSAKGRDSLNGMIQNWMAGAPEDAMAWAQALPAGDSRDSIMSLVVTGFVSTDLDRAQALFGQLSPAGQGNAAGAIANAIFQESPEKACAWAQSLPEGAAQKNAFRTVAHAWASEDLDVAGRWLRTLPLGTARDAAISSFCDSAFDHDPEGALAWSLTISSPRDRDRNVEELVWQWSYSDSTAARAWLNANTEITPAEKDRILNGAPITIPTRWDD